MISEKSIEYQDTFERVSKVVKEVLQIPDEEISMASRFNSDLGANSIDLMTVMLELEDEFDREIPEEYMMILSTIGDVVKYIEKNI
ncbi:MAG: acyl carrier protein [Ruminiclostridium sp.]